MGVIVNTSLLIAAERGALRFDALLASLGTDTVAMAAITASELLHGCHRATDPGIRIRRSAYVDALLDLIPALPFGLAEARRHAELWAELARAGTPVGPHDMMIGATALARGDSVATLDQREFARIAGMRILPIDAFLT